MHAHTHAGSKRPRLGNADSDVRLKINSQIASSSSLIKTTKLKFSCKLNVH